MQNIEKHVEYIKETLNSRDILYYLTEQDRLATIFWALNSLKILKDPYFHEIKRSLLDYLLLCEKEDGGFGPNSNYSATILSTFNALQIFYILGIPYKNSKTVDFILKLQNVSGAFTFDKYGDIDTRLDCCAILSLKLLSIMEKYPFPDKNSGERISEILFEKFSVNFDKNELNLPIDKSFLDRIDFKMNITLNHLLSCYNSDGGFGQIKGSESHGAQVFCVISCLKILGFLEIVDREQIIGFLVNRQLSNGGLCGRVDKKEDVCYSFWDLSALMMLEDEELIDYSKLRDFILSCEGENGGFSDRPGNEVDLYHLMYSLASLSLLGNENLDKINPCFCL